MNTAYSEAYHSIDEFMPADTIAVRDAHYRADSYQHFSIFYIVDYLAIALTLYSEVYERNVAQDSASSVQQDRN